MSSVKPFIRRRLALHTRGFLPVRTYSWTAPKDTLTTLIKRSSCALAHSRPAVIILLNGNLRLHKCVGAPAESVFCIYILFRYEFVCVENKEAFYLCVRVCACVWDGPTCRPPGGTAACCPVGTGSCRQLILPPLGSWTARRRSAGIETHIHNNIRTPFLHTHTHINLWVND